LVGKHANAVNIVIGCDHDHGVDPVRKTLKTGQG